MDVQKIFFTENGALHGWVVPAALVGICVSVVVLGTWALVVTIDNEVEADEQVCEKLCSRLGHEFIYNKQRGAIARGPCLCQDGDRRYNPYKASQ